MSVKTDSLSRLSENVAKELLPVLTKDLRELATLSDWPARLVAGLRVEFTDDHTLVVDYPDDLREEIENMEYGDLNGLPNAAIRPFVMRAPQVIEDLLEQRVLPELLVDLGVF